MSGQEEGARLSALPKLMEVLPEVIRWPITPASLFVSVITAVVAGAALITAGVLIGERRVMPQPTNPVSQRTDAQLTETRMQLNQLAEAMTRMANRPQAPLQATVNLPADSIKVQLEPAKPQIIHVRTDASEVFKVLEPLVDDLLKVRNPETKVVKAPAPTPALGPAPKKKVMDKDGEKLPPPKGTAARVEWDKAHPKEK